MLTYVFPCGGFHKWGLTLKNHQCSLDFPLRIIHFDRMFPYKSSMFIHFHGIVPYQSLQIIHVHRIFSYTSPMFIQVHRIFPYKSSKFSWDFPRFSWDFHGFYLINQHFFPVLAPGSSFQRQLQGAHLGAQRGQHLPHLAQSEVLRP